MLTPNADLSSGIGIRPGILNPVARRRRPFTPRDYTLHERRNNVLRHLTEHAGHPDPCRATDLTLVDPLHIHEDREIDLVAELERCLPPMDQHHTELERVRIQLAKVGRDRG